MALAALSDLDGLMKNAREIVQVVEKYSQLMAESQTPDGMSETSTEIGEINEMESILQNIGIISPVTKLSAGRLYHQQLAQQIADLLHSKNCLSRLGGMATVTDIYCLYNRARGTELVSPDDFYQAVILLETVPSLQLRMRQFDSGVRVIAEAGLNMQHIFRKIVDLARESPVDGVSISEVAAAFQISILVAKEQVNLAECEGLIVRDGSFSGLQYFENRFDSFLNANIAISSR
jgi:ESCRT-II complex subunit VPS36